jgi:hypothetical protein
MTRMMMTTTAVVVLVAVAAAMMMMRVVVMKEVDMEDVAISAVKPFVQSRDPSKVQGTCRTSRFVHACHHYQ